MQSLQLHCQSCRHGIGVWNLCHLLWRSFLQTIAVRADRQTKQSLLSPENINTMCSNNTDKVTCMGQSTQNRWQKYWVPPYYSYKLSMHPIKTTSIKLQRQNSKDNLLNTSHFFSYFLHCMRISQKLVIILLFWWKQRKTIKHSYSKYKVSCRVEGHCFAGSFTGA